MEQKGGNKVFYTVPFIWNRTLWVMTFAVFAFWIGMSGWQLYTIFTSESAVVALIAFLIFNGIMLATVLMCEGYAPQRLEIGEDKIVILRRYNSVTINRDEVKSIERLPDNAMTWAVRTGGVGGLFGYYGSYYSRKIGSFTLYATSFRNLYLIRRWDGKSVVISCSEPDKMVFFKA